MNEKIKAFRERTGAKVGAVVLAVVFFLLAVVSFVAGYQRYQQNYFRDVSCEQAIQNELEWMMVGTAQQVYRLYSYGNIRSAQTLMSTSGLDYMEVGNCVLGDPNSVLAYVTDINMSQSGYVGITAKTSYDWTTSYGLYANWIRIVYTIGSVGPVSAPICLLLMIACIVFLCFSAGHHVGEEGIRVRWYVLAPWAAMTALYALVFLGLIGLTNLVIEWERMEYSYMPWSVLAVLGVLALLVLIHYLMNFALRVKSGKFFHYTLIGYIVRGLVKLIRIIPLIWKAAFVCLILIIANVFITTLVLWQTFWIILYLLEILLLIPAIIYGAILLRRLKDGGKRLADGDLTYQTSLKGMFWDFKDHAEDLNSISGGMALAVEERMKSERMKTELITNVSHDIKTPLTSIINYANLIAQENCDNPTITEYASVLKRQGDRLKKLLEDMIEMSKASTGNLEVQVVPCEAGILLEQIVGENEDRLKASNLELIVTAPKEPIRILADGRRLWRVLDNLMNNIIKYSLPGTRVYVDLNREGEYAVYSFKNISAEPLNMSEEELMERFTRADSSRNTEGHGLGLSIADSLVQLQQGNLKIKVDGDLFKAIVRIPLA